MMSKASEREPCACPFCGGRAIYKQGHFTGYVMCLKCEVMGPNLVGAEAVAAWNRRASTPAEPVAWKWEHVLNATGAVVHGGLSEQKIEPTSDAFWDGRVSTRVTPLCPCAAAQPVPPAWMVMIGFVEQSATREKRHGPIIWTAAIDNLAHGTLIYAAAPAIQEQPK